MRVGLDVRQIFIALLKVGWAGQVRSTQGIANAVANAMTQGYEGKKGETKCNLFPRELIPGVGVKPPANGKQSGPAQS